MSYYEHVAIINLYSYKIDIIQVDRKGASLTYPYVRHFRCVKTARASINRVFQFRTIHVSLRIYTERFFCIINLNATAIS